MADEFQASADQEGNVPQFLRLARLIGVEKPAVEQLFHNDDRSGFAPTQFNFVFRINHVVISWKTLNQEAFTGRELGQPIAKTLPMGSPYRWYKAAR